MAKAKKTPTTGDAPTTEPKQKLGIKGKKVAPPTTPAPMVDTALAAHAAAKQLVAGLALPMPTSGKESASFKQMKDSIAKPAGSGLDSVLDKTAQPGTRKTAQPFAGGRGFGGGGGGRNQTFGADVNRTGVPRRTSGG